MRLVSLAGLMIAASALAGPLPASAQVLPIALMLPPEHPATESFAAATPSLPTSFFHPASAATPAASPTARPASRPVNAEQVLAATAPLPPVRPALAEAPQAPTPRPVDIAPKPIVTASMGPVGQSQSGQGQPLPNSTIVERANAYFTNLGTLVADFTQVGGDGRRMGGTLYLQRPGKVRFEYDPPATLQVIADGRSVAVRDRNLATQDLYSISQTPLKFLLRERVNLGQDIRITGISSEPNAVRINLEDSSTLGGTSRITLYFDPEVQNLNQWRIQDAQGFQTVVVLNGAQKGRRIDQDMFRIQYEEIRGSHK